MIRQLLTKIEKILSIDKPISNFCTLHYGKAPTLYIFVDEDNPAPESDYPVIAVTGFDKQSTDNGPKVTYHLEIGCGVVNETINEESTQTGTKVKRYTGMLQASELMELIENALVAARFAKVEFHGKTNSINWYPKFITTTTAVITHVVGRRK